MKVAVRIIRTYEVDVDAEYGDTEVDLAQRGVESVTPETSFSETAVVMPQED